MSVSLCLPLSPVLGVNPGFFAQCCPNICARLPLCRTASMERPAEAYSYNHTALEKHESPLDVSPASPVPGKTTTCLCSKPAMSQRVRGSSAQHLELSWTVLPLTALVLGMGCPVIVFRAQKLKHELAVLPHMDSEPHQVVATE